MADILSPEERDVLTAFMRLQASRGFDYGAADCGLYLADWVVAAKGVPDPAAAVRGTYSTADGAAAVLGTVGFLDFVGGCADAAGCPVTDDPQDGDIAVLSMPNGLTGAIKINNSWAFRTPKGIAWARVAPGRIVQSWAVFHA